MASSLTGSSARRGALRWSRAVPPHRRPLHMTLPAPSPSTWLRSDLPQSRYQAQALTDLRSQCRQRKLNVAGSKTELADRLISDDAARSRSYTIAAGPGTEIYKRPSTIRNIPLTALPHRTFNTTRVLKTPKDTSTIDFAFLPDLPKDVAPLPSPSMPPPRFTSFAAPVRDQPILVPFQPPTPTTSRATSGDTSTEPSTGAATLAAALGATAAVFRPEISTVAHESTHRYGAPSAMEEGGSDHAAVGSDSSANPLSATLSEGEGGIGSATVEKVGGAVRKVWDGLVDDVFGSGGRAGASGKVA